MAALVDVHPCSQLTANWLPANLFVVNFLVVSVQYAPTRLNLVCNVVSKQNDIQKNNSHTNWHVMMIWNAQKIMKIVNLNSIS